MHARTTLYHVGGWPYNSMADAREGLIVVGWVLFGMGIIGASRVGKCVDDASVDDGKCGGGLNLKVNVVLLKPRPPLSAPSVESHLFTR